MVKDKLKSHLKLDVREDKVATWSIFSRHKQKV